MKTLASRALAALFAITALLCAGPSFAGMDHISQPGGIQAVPWANYKRVFFDDFGKLDQRVANPSTSIRERDLDNGSGTWTTFPYYAPDNKGSNGLGSEFWLNQGYLCGGSNFDRISVSGGILAMTTLPTPAACTTAGITRNYLSAFMSTRNSWLVRDKFVACARAQMSGVVGSIDAPIWSITRPPSPFPGNGNRERYEVDGGEQPGYAPKALTHALLGDFGGSYQSDAGNTTTSTDFSKGFHVFCQKVEKGSVEFWVDGQMLRKATASANWSTTNRWHYLVVDLGLDTDTGTLFGASNSYAGATATMRVDWVAAYVPRDYVQGKDYLDWRTPDGEGADLMEDDPSASSFVANCFWYDQTSVSTTGSALVEPNEIVPSVAKSAGAVWHGREGGCNSPKGVVNGTTYHATFAYNYVSGGFGAYIMTACTGNNVTINVTGTTPTVAGGTATNVRVIYNPLGWYELKFDWNPGCTGNWTTRFTPNSTVSGDNVLAYRMKLKS